MLNSAVYIGHLDRTGMAPSNKTEFIEVGNITQPPPSIWIGFRTYRFLNQTRNVQMFDAVINVYLLSVICVVGILGNILTILVLRRDDEKPKTTLFLLQSLAVVDAFYLLTAILTNPLDFLFDLTNGYDFIMPYIDGVAYVAETGSVWVVLLVTIDRYIAVCFPWKVKWKELGRAKIGVAVVLVSAAIYSIPMFIGSIRGNFVFILVYHIVCYAIFRAAGPLATLLVLNGYLMREVQLMRKRHLELTKRQAQPDNVTLILVVVVTVFLICQLPTVALRIVWAVGVFTHIGSDSEFETFYVLYFITDVLLVLNSSVNFVIYCALGKTFRETLVQMFRPTCCGGGVQEKPNVRETESENIS